MKKFLFTLLVRPKLVGQAINYVASFAAAYIVTYWAGLPGWAVDLISELAGAEGTLEVTDGGTTAVLTVLIAQIVNWAITKSNATGVEKIQEKVREIGYDNVVADAWAGNKTVGAVSAMAAEIQRSRAERQAYEESRQFKDGVGPVEGDGKTLPFPVD